MESNPIHVMPKQKHIGSRTHKDVKAGKIIRVDEDGFENFSDYWTDPDTPQSPASVHSRPSIHPDNRQTESHLLQRNESSATMSPFTPSQDESTNPHISSPSGFYETSSKQPSDATSQIIPSTEEPILAADNVHVAKTIIGNVNQAKSNDDVTATAELPKMVTDLKSKIPVRMKGARAKTAEADGDESDGMKGVKSSDVAAASSCVRGARICQDPLGTKDTSRGGYEKCLDQLTTASKTVINPVVVLQDLNPRCSVVPGTSSLTCVSFPLNMKGDIAGTLSRPTIGLPLSADVDETSPDIVKPTRKRLNYSTESPLSSDICQGTQQSDVVRSEVNGKASSSLSSTDKRNETDVPRGQPLESLMVAETSKNKPEASRSSEAKYEEFPVVSRQRKSHCPAEIKPKDMPSSCSPSNVTNTVASVGRSLHLESAEETSQSNAFSHETQTAVPKGFELQIPVDNEIEVDNLQDIDIFSEAGVFRNVECFDLFDKAPSSLVPTCDMIAEEDDLVADGKEDETLIPLPSRNTEERNQHDADDRSDDDGDDFEMAPLSQVRTVKLNYNAANIKAGSKQVKKSAKTKAKRNLVVIRSNSNSPDSMDLIKRTSVGEQNDTGVGSQTITERPDSTKGLRVHTSKTKGDGNKVSKARKEALTNNESENKTASDPLRKPGGATFMDVAKNVRKNGQRRRKGYKRTKESQPSDIVGKRRKRTQGNDYHFSEQEEEDLSTEEMDHLFKRGALPSQSVTHVRHAETREEEDMADAIIVTTERKKSVVSSECERSSSEETEEETEVGKEPEHKANTIKNAADSIRKGRMRKRKSLPNKNIIKSGTDTFKKNTRTNGKNKRIIQQQIDRERRKEPFSGNTIEEPIALEPMPINERVGGSDYSGNTKKTVSREDENVTVTGGQMGSETTDGTVVSDLRQNSMLHNVSNIEPAKTHLGSSLRQYISTPKTMRRSRRQAVAVAKRKSSLMLRQGQRKKMNSVSRQSLVSKQIEDVAPTLEDTPGNVLMLADAQNSSDLLSDDSTVRRKVRKSVTLQEQPLVVTILDGVENNETPETNQRNTTERPRTSFSVASRLHYCDSTVSQEKSGKQKPRKVFPPVGDDAGGNRRSRRTRVRALDWFRNERIHYERRESGFVVAGIYSPKIEAKFGAAEKVAPAKKMSCKEKHPEKKSHTERNLSIHADISHSLLPSTQSEIKVVNPETQEEVFMECVKTLDQAKMVGVSGKAPTDDEPLLLCKPIRQKTFASGTLIIRPLQVKKMQFVQNDTMLFHVIHGKVEVTIHQTNFIVEARDKFFVPVGNSYSIRNLRNDDAELDFTQIKS